MKRIDRNWVKVYILTLILCYAIATWDFKNALSAMLVLSVVHLLTIKKEDDNNSNI